MTPSAKIVQDALTKLITEGNQNFFIIDLTEDFYIQASGEINNFNIIVEAVSNAYLPPKRQLTAEQDVGMKKMGWSLSDESSNYEIKRSIETAEGFHEVLDLILLTADKIYGCKEIKQEMVEVVFE